PVPPAPLIVLKMPLSPRLPPPPLHDALPISAVAHHPPPHRPPMKPAEAIITDFVLSASEDLPVSKRAELYRALARLTSNHETIGDRKSTRLNSSHVKISYAVCCLTKKQRPRW